MIPAATLKLIQELGQGTWAVEDFARMRVEIPNFDYIYRGRVPQVYKVLKITPSYVKLQGEGFTEWHRRDFYKIINLSIQ